MDQMATYTKAENAEAESRKQKAPEDHAENPTNPAKKNEHQPRKSGR